MSQLDVTFSADLERTDHRLPLYARLRDVLTSRIAGGEWVHGTPLPSENALADAFGVSVGTIRKALQQLVDEGLLERRHGNGTFVRRAKLDKSLHRFFRYAGNSAERGPESRILSRRIDAAGEDDRVKLDLTLDERVIRIERLRLWGEEPFLAERIVLPLHRFAPLMNAKLEELGPFLYPIYEERCREIVASAKEELRFSSADAATARLLGCVRGDSIVVISRTARGHDGRPLEWRVSRGLAEKFVYSVEIH
jgi:GntR family transcriptional regulator